MLGMSQELLGPKMRGPLVCKPREGRASDLAELLADQRPELQSLLVEHGALLFRGFDVDSVARFDRFVSAVTAQRIDYVYRSTPRTGLGPGIFTATEYPAKQTIPLHNENAYQRDWPLQVAFACLVPAASGGATPIADMRRVSHSVGTSLLDKFEALQVKYVRHYWPYVDIPWQTAFQADTAEAVAEFCTRAQIEHEWLPSPRPLTDDKVLRTAQVSQGVARHPITRERTLFNQAHLFHVSSLDPNTAESLKSLYGAQYLPRHACYGDGSEIALDELECIRNAFRAHAVTFEWHKGDVLLLDNMQFAHGRQTYQGERRVVVALLEPYSQAACASQEA